VTASRHPVEVWIVMSESGKYVVADAEELASDRADAEINENETRRYVNLRLTLSPPREDEVSVRVVDLDLG
jgi:hypothetical protein